MSSRICPFCFSTLTSFVTGIFLKGRWYKFLGLKKGAFDQGIPAGIQIEISVTLGRYNVKMLYCSASRLLLDLKKFNVPSASPALVAAPPTGCAPEPSSA